MPNLIKLTKEQESKGILKIKTSLHLYSSIYIYIGVNRVQFRWPLISFLIKKKTFTNYFLPTHFFPHRPRRRRPSTWCQSQERRQQLRLRAVGNGSDQRQATGEQQGDAHLSEPSQFSCWSSRWRSRGWAGVDLWQQAESVHHTPHCTASASAARVASGAAVA